MAAPCNDEQRSQATRQSRNRPRSGITQLERLTESANACIRAASQGLRSGQQRNLELSVWSMSSTMTSATEGLSVGVTRCSILGIFRCGYGRSLCFADIGSANMYDGNEAFRCHPTIIEAVIGE